ncbi:hypothetical protein P8C59_009626 [Phyllachora maydis]|uniref:Uncharacterized protein n=1 Tax=Phyllachora maydis TaxID=1825666 RepID=A0AAD9IED8_9PEZI|nr:hypothetical protein P8C59_009626 [Phyllachora maydis]
MADILEESRNPAIKGYRAAHIANSSNSTPNSSFNPSKKGKNKKKGSYNLAIEEEEEESDSSSNSSFSSDSNTQLAQLLANSKEQFTTFTPNTGQLRPINTGKSPVSPAGISSITLEVLSRKAPPTYTKLVLDNVLYLPNININIMSRVGHYDSGGCLIKETLYRVNRRYIAVLDFKKSGFFLNVKGSSKPILHANFAFPLGPTKDNTGLSQPTNNTALEGELVDLDLDLEGAVSPDPSNLNTKKPISIEIGPSKLEPYKSSSDSKLDEPSPDKPINPVIVESTRPTISIRKPKLAEAFPQTIEPIFATKP